METIVVLGFLLIPLLGAVMVAAPMFGVAFALNALLRKQPLASKFVHVVALAAMTAYFLYAIQGELGRNKFFMIAFIVGASICYFIYLAALVKLNKSARSLEN